MNKDLLKNEIIELNRRYFSVCLRLSAENEVETCLDLNISLKVLRLLRCMSQSEIEILVQTPAFLLMPSIDEVALKAVVKMENPIQRVLYLQSVGNSKHV